LADWAVRFSPAQEWRLWRQRWTATRPDAIDGIIISVALDLRGTPKAVILHGWYVISFFQPCSQLNKDKSLCSWISGLDAPFPPEASPINLVTPDFPPTFILVAENDSLIPPTYSYDLQRVLAANGVQVETGVAMGMEHGQIEGLGLWERLEEEQGWWGQAVLPALTFAVEHL
jgi:acetyl esterase/lipase